MVQRSAEQTGSSEAPAPGSSADHGTVPPAEEGQSGPSPVVGGSDEQSSGRPGIRELEHEGDIAADYLEGLLDIADLDGDIDLDVENDRAMVSIVGGELQSLVGRDGEVLDALQELTRLAVLRETGHRSRLMLDVGGFRAARRQVLADTARVVIEQVRTSQEPVRLEPMTAFERKVVHDVVAEAGLRSESEGEAPGRRVVVYPS